MIQTKILSIQKEKIILLAQFITLTTIILIAPLFSSQAISGSLVNGVLFSSVIILGIQASILLSLIPSLIALSVGLLPIFFVPLVPLIIISNIILVVSFNYFKSIGFLKAVIISGFLKLAFLSSLSLIFINLFIEKEIVSKAVIIFSWPQLFTALAGGLISYLFLKGIKKI